jgi:hypothetical protein
MQYSLKWLLIGATVLPPVLAGSWFASHAAMGMFDRTNWGDWQAFINQCAAMAALIALVTIVGIFCQRAGSGS